MVSIRSSTPLAAGSWPLFHTSSGKVSVSPGTWCSCSADALTFSCVAPLVRVRWSPVTVASDAVPETVTVPLLPTAAPGFGTSVMAWKSEVADARSSVQRLPLQCSDGAGSAKSATPDRSTARWTWCAVAPPATFHR
ncbi:hypothetical protein OHN37_42800 [Streptomyces sp. NBC_00485]|uniref:hypothetical protein n=1 Tax=Streptomyces sp. NBC_00485 TaxID=2975758 RepID=UPI002E17F821